MTSIIIFLVTMQILSFIGFFILEMSKEWKYSEVIEQIVIVPLCLIIGLGVSGTFLGKKYMESKQKKKYKENNKPKDMLKYKDLREFI